MNKPTRNIKKTPTKTGSNTSRNILIVVIVLIGVYLIYEFAIKEEEVVVPPVIERPVDKVPEPQFKKEGDLTFLNSDGKEVKKIEIEIADNGEERQKGLMYRKSMDEAKGMLFVFPVEDQQAFWMKNTVLSLDIMFVGKDKKIVKIHKNTTPFSEKDLPSGKPAMYVVETIAGFSDKYGIKEGDKIEFSYQ
jgi:uncharacterized protein